MTDFELKAAMADKMVSFDANVRHAINNLQGVYGIFSKTENGLAVYSQEVPIMTAKAEFMADGIKWYTKYLQEALADAEEIIKLWNDLYGE